MWYDYNDYDKEYVQKKVDRVSIPFQCTYLSHSLSFTRFTLSPFCFRIKCIALQFFKLCIPLLLNTYRYYIIGGVCVYAFLFLWFLTFWLLIVLIFCTNWVHEQVCMFCINTFYRVSCGAKYWAGWVWMNAFQLYLEPALEWSWCMNANIMCGGGRPREREKIEREQYGKYGWKQDKKRTHLLSFFLGFIGSV